MRGKNYIAEFLEKTPIQQFYSGKSIFITGGTGFIGKLLIERLLYHCYDIEKIYLLLRPKNGESSQKRLDDFLNSELFAKLEDGWKNKIEAVYGELGEENLRLSEQDRNSLIQNVNVVFHSAATVRFDEKLKIALKVNVIGTFDIINLCKQMKNLKAFVHVSTAFANCAFGINIEEKFYKSGMSLKEAKVLSEIEDQEILELFKYKLLKNWPNSYSYTKSIAEEVISREARNLPVIIFRPGIVMGTTGKHTIVGYTENFFGPSGLLAAVGTGVLRLLKINKKTRTNMLPADFCANGIIASGWDISQRLETTPPIINYLPPNKNNVLWGNVVELWLKAVNYIPPSKSIWYPCMTLAPCKYDYQIRKFLLHIFPAILIDSVFKLTGEKLNLMSIYRKMDKLIGLIVFFCAKNWIFEMKEMNRVISRMNLKDRDLFYSDLSTLNWSTYSTTIVHGVRQYLLKDKVSVPEARKKLKTLKILHQGLKYIVIALVAIFVWMWMQVVLKYLK